MEYEIYYGYYLGSHKTWDTAYVTVNPEDGDEAALVKFQYENLSELAKKDITVAFFGILAVFPLEDK